MGPWSLQKRGVSIPTREHTQDEHVRTWRRSSSQGLQVWHPHLGLQNKDLMWPREMVHVFNSSTQEAEAGGSEFEASLVYIVSSRMARATQRNPVVDQKKSTLLLFLPPVSALGYSSLPGTDLLIPVAQKPYKV